MKIKTNRRAAKRFKLTGDGKIKRNKAYASQLLASKRAKRRRNLRKGTLVDSANIGSVRRMLPYL